MKSYLKAIFTMIREVLQQKQVYTNKNKKIVSSGDNAETAFRILCTPYFFQEQFSDGSTTIDNYGSSLINKGKIQGQNGFRVGKAMIEMCLNGGLYSLKKHLDNIFLDSSAYNYFTSNYDLAPMYMLNKKKDIKQLDVDMFEKNRTSLMDECNQAYVNVLLVLSEVLKREIYKNSFNYYSVDNSSVSSEKATLFLTVLIAAYIRKLETEKLTDEHKKEVEQLLEQLEKEISTFVRDNNLGSGKLTQEDLRAFPYVESKDTDNTKFKRISEFFITPALKLNNSNDIFRCVIEGKSGVGKSTLLKAITNIFVIENTEATEFDDNEKSWYKTLKKSVFVETDKTYIPVFIEAKKANKYTSGFEFLDLVEGYEKSLLENIVSCNDNVLFLIDGVEEVKKEKRSDFERAFEKYFEANKKANIIITTRYLGSFDSLIKGFSLVSLEKLSFESIKSFVEKSNIFDENIRERIFEILSINEDVKKLACNPFMFERLIKYCTDKDFTVFVYLNKTVNDIIKLRWNSPGEYIKNMLGYVATKGNEFNYNRFMSLINTLPKPLSIDYNNAPKNQQEYEIFKEEWESNSGILSYVNNAEGEKVSFDEPLIRSYLASLYIKRWFTYIQHETEEGKEDYLCLKKPSKDINYFEYLDLIKLIDKTFDLTDKNVLQAFLMVLSSRKKGMDDFEDPIIMMSVFLKYSSLSISDADEVSRNNIVEFFRNLKSNTFGNNIVTNDSCKPSQLAMKNNVDYIIYGNNQVNKDE